MVDLEAIQERRVNWLSTTLEETDIDMDGLIAEVERLRADVEEAQETIGLLFEERGRLRERLRLAHVTFGMILLAPGDKDGVIELAKEGTALLDKPEGGREGG